jgi:curved DNA-binding protein CbpA
MLSLSVSILDSKRYYAILGVSEHASTQQIKRAYRCLARKYHPDRNGSDVSDDMTKRINAAFEVLSDKDKREQYDKADFNYNNIASAESEKSNKDNEDKQNRASTDSVTNNKNNNDDAYSENFTNNDTYSKYESADDKNDYTQSAKFGTDAAVATGPIDIPKGRFHIIVEPSLCMAFGSCETLAPGIFVVEKNKRINPKARVESETAGTFDEILAAAETCPTKAISIIDRYTGEQIYP